MKVCTLDIESNKLLADSVDYSKLPYKLNKEARLWLVVIRDVNTEEVFIKRNENITKEWLKSVLDNYDVIITCNGHKFDLPMLFLFGVLDYKIGYLGKPDIVFGREVRLLDVLVMSRLLWPDRGGHSLHWWGEKLGKSKIDFRQVCIDKEYIDAKAPKGAEFEKYVPEMDEYCIGDNEVTALIYKELWPQIEKYRGWQQALQQELILADYGIHREIFGFWFDKELALKCVEDLQQKIQHCYDKVTPLLPPKPLNKGELSAVTPPKIQLKKDGTPTNHLINFALKHNAEIINRGNKWIFLYKKREIPIPFENPLETEGKADISDLDHVKMHLLNLGWIPSEFKERDLTKDSKKQDNPYVKRIASLRKYIEETLSGKYKKERLEILNIPIENLYEVLSEKLKENRPVRVPISPVIRPGLEKELDPNLVKLGEKVEFAKDFADYLTYRHRLNSIASGSAMGGDEWSPEESSSGFLHMYNEINGRVRTPAIECATNTNRYRHIGVCNICRVTSTYGREMRSLFGVPKDKVFFNFDYSSLEQRCSAHYIYKYPNGIEQGKSYLAEKPNDSHTKLSKILGIPRSEAKSVSYGVQYGAQPKKLSKMLNCNLDRAKEIYDGFWETNSALSNLKQNLEKFWEKTGKKYIIAIDGRKLIVRSQHALINTIYQSMGIIYSKYVTIFIKEILEREGFNMNPFIDSNKNILGIIEMHDEAGYEVDPKILNIKTFETEEKAKDFVKNWKGGQLSAIGHGKKPYICLPNVLSEAILEAMGRTNKLLKINVPMGMEWQVGRNWSQTH